jgi:hypothetical protein
MFENTRNASQGCELICGYFRESSYIDIVIPVSLVRSVDLPTDGNPIIPTLASPAFETSKPSPATFLPPAGSINYLLSFASLALRSPKWLDVALFFWVFYIYA